uniref:Zinc finger MYM-type protein 1-like n=1 Tax=Cyprinus carpio carpio TaxID=630221 RepID=A0A9J8CL73_CYPCA
MKDLKFFDLFAFTLHGPTITHSNNTFMPHQRPYQPKAGCFIQQQLASKTLSFQDRWYKNHTWLHYCPDVRGILCFYCMKAFRNQTSPLARSVDQSFVSTGLQNWKKAIEKFKAHEMSQAHKVAITTHTHQAKSIDTQLSSAKALQQQQARSHLLKIVSSLQFLARQGTAIRRHENSEGNFRQLLRLRSEDVEGLESWIERRSNFLSPQIQNDILQILSLNIVREIASAVRNLLTLQYSIIMDGTQDVAGVEQESICIWYVDHDLIPHEEFVGLYEVSSTTGENLARVAVDVLQRMNLPLSGLCGQTYDGAANMSGKTGGVQAKIKEIQPLALYVHCGPHCVNLVTQAACSSSCIAKSEHGNIKTLKPLCPTRWVVRMSAIRAVLGQYKASGYSETTIKARGLLERFQKGTTVLGHLLACEVIGELECLNYSLQTSTGTVMGMTAAVDCVKSTLKAKRSDEMFHHIHTKATKLVTSTCTEPIQMPHARKPPKHFTGNATAFVPVTTEEHYRIDFFKMLDTVDMQLTMRFEQSSLQVLDELERVLLTGKMQDVVSQYPELDPHSLEVQLPMFKLQFDYSTTLEATNILKNLLPEVRSLFSQVETLVRLLLVVPSSSAEAERSFSSLGSLKTWLRSTMSQTCLNSTAICHIHQNKLDHLDRARICEQFISANDQRRHVFGTFN